MFTVTHERISASVAGISSCGFPEVKYAPDCQFATFSTRQMRESGWHLDYNACTETFVVTNPHTIPTSVYRFELYVGLHFYRQDLSAVPTAQLMTSPQLAPPPLHIKDHLAILDAIDPPTSAAAMVRDLTHPCTPPSLSPLRAGCVLRDDHAGCVLRDDHAGCVLRDDHAGCVPRDKDPCWLCAA